MKKERYLKVIPEVTIIWSKMLPPYIHQRAIYTPPKGLVTQVLNEYQENVNEAYQAAIVVGYSEDDYIRWYESFNYDWMSYEKVKKKYLHSPCTSFRDIGDIMFPKCQLCGYYRPDRCTICDDFKGSLFSR
jgi:hypothetical protein